MRSYESISQTTKTFASTGAQRQQAGRMSAILCQCKKFPIFYAPIYKCVYLIKELCGELACFQITILFADLHGYLDNLKSTFELLDLRVQYYQHIIKALLTAFNVPIDKLNFVKGSTYQLKQYATIINENSIGSCLLENILRMCSAYAPMSVKEMR